MLAVGELEGGAVPLLLPVARSGDVVLTVVESSLPQLATVVVCASEQVEPLTRLWVYSDCVAKNSLLLGGSSVPLDKLPWQKYHPASLSFKCRTRN